MTLEEALRDAIESNRRNRDPHVWIAQKEHWLKELIDTQEENRYFYHSLWLSRATNAENLCNMFRTYIRLGCSEMEMDCLGNVDTHRIKMLPYKWIERWECIRQKCMRMLEKRYYPGK